MNFSNIRSFAQCEIHAFRAESSSKSHKLADFPVNFIGPLERTSEIQNPNQDRPLGTDFRRRI